MITKTQDNPECLADDGYREAGSSMAATVRHAAAAKRQLRIVLVIPRGEAVRNFLYSDTLRILSEHSRVTVLSVVTNEKILAKARPFSEEIITIEEYPAHPAAAYLRTLIEHAHDRWLWSKVAQNNWELRTRRAAQKGGFQNIQWKSLSAAARIFGNRPCLRLLTAMEQQLQWRSRTTRKYDQLLARLKPDLVFNGSHIHGPAGELPMRVAHAMGIRTAGFIFSWDNLTSRSRVLVPYDYWFVWHEKMKQQLLGIYPEIRPESVLVTGTPQMDFHFRPEYLMPREELARCIGIDPSRPFILYTTGIDYHFPKEHLHVEAVIRRLQEMDAAVRPQLVVRNYIKGTSLEMKALSAQKMKDVVFPLMLWDREWATPLPEDLNLYCSLVHHAAMSINAASTVTLEFYLKDKPVINLDLIPPGSNLAPCDGFKRHIQFDHFKPVAESGGSFLARSNEDLSRMIAESISNPATGSAGRRRYMRETFGETLDGRCGERVAQSLLKLARNHENS